MRIIAGNNHKGSALGLNALIIMMMFIILGIALCLGSWYSCRQQANTAADLAAFSAAKAVEREANPCLIASQTAQRNKSRLVNCWIQTRSKGVFLVFVEVETEIKPQIPGGPNMVTAKSKAGKI